MTDVAHAPGTPRERPLQATTCLSILLAMGLGVAGFFRLLDPRVLFDGPALADGQFLAILLLPLVSLGPVLVVCVEGIVSAIRVLRSPQPFRDQLSDRGGYRVLRIFEAGVAILGVLLTVAAIPVLVADTTPAPAGVGVLLLIFATGMARLVAGPGRSGAEPFRLVR